VCLEQLTKAEHPKNKPLDMVVGFHTYEWKGDDSLGSAAVNLDPESHKEHTHVFPSPGEPCYVWLQPPSRLKMNSLRSALKRVPLSCRVERQLASE
jgi:hypothetical protein